MQPGILPQTMGVQPGPSSSRSLGTLSHLGSSIGAPFSIGLSLFLPLVSYLIKDGQSHPRDELLLDHLRESTNASITFLIACLIHGALAIVLIGLVTGVMHWILFVIWSLQANSTLNRGQPYRYPLTIRLFK